MSAEVPECLSEEEKKIHLFFTLRHWDTQTLFQLSEEY